MEVQRFTGVGRDIFGLVPHREINHQRQDEADAQQGGEMTQHAPNLVAAPGDQRRIGEWRCFHRCLFLGHPGFVLPVSDDALILSASLQW